MDILLINFVLYIVYTLYIFKKNFKFSLYHLAWSWFTLIAFMGYYAYMIGAYSTIFKDDGKFVIEPFLFCFLSVFLLLLPIRKFQSDYSIESYLELDQRKLAKLGSILLFFELLRFIVNFILFVTIFSTTGLSDAYENYHTEGSSALNLAEWQLKILWITQHIHDSFFWFIPMIAIVTLNNKDIISRKWLWITFFTMSAEVLGYLSRSARGELLYLILKIGMMMALLWPCLESAIKKRVISASMLLGGLLFVYAIYITIDRFENSDLDTADGIFRYLGEPFPNLGNQLWENVRNHPMGLRFLPFLFGFEETSSSVGDYQDFWEMFVGVPMLNFKTIYGDFYIEFGKYGGLIGIFILSMIWMFVLRNKNIRWYMIPIWSIYWHTITMAPLYFTYRGTSKYVQILWAIIFMFIIKKYLYKKV